MSRKMPIYEILNEKLTVIIDIGAAYTNGEFAPRCIIRSEVQCKKTGELRKITDYKDASDLFDLLVEFIHGLYFKHALFSPKDRPIVVVESLLTPTLFRETLARVLFEHFELVMQMTVHSHVVSLAPLAVTTGVVLDVGYKEAVAMPICHGRPQLHAWQSLDVGSRKIHENLRTLLSFENSGIDSLPEYVIEDIKVRCCFVTKRSRAGQLIMAKPEITFAPEVKYPVGGSDIITVSGKVREKAYEVLYEENLDQLCLANLILDAIMKIDVHLRHPLASSVLLMGGTTMAPGFRARLKEELKVQLQKEQYRSLKGATFKFHSPPCKENYSAWLGGAIYGATEVLGMKGLVRESYFKEKRVPDWPNMRDNSRLA